RNILIVLFTIHHQFIPICSTEYPLSIQMKPENEGLGVVENTVFIA
ncbi:MAG: hypothetical protein UV90_C0002G0136, partial [candidate division WWE3 bacterium GW2011_GWA2_43_24]